MAIGPAATPSRAAGRKGQPRFRNELSGPLTPDGTTPSASTITSRPHRPPPREQGIRKLAESQYSNGVLFGPGER
jgi:hypothetical protein